MSDLFAREQAANRGSRRRAHADDSLRLPPAVLSSTLSALVVGGAWFLDRLDAVPTEAGVFGAVAAAGGLLWWTVTRSRRTRNAVAHISQLHAEHEGALRQLRAQRDEALGALASVMAAIDKGREQVRWALGQAQQGAARTNFAEPAVHPRTGDVRLDVIPALEAGFTEAWQAVMRAAAHTHGVLNPQAELAEIFKSVAPRLQSLVNRSISVISEVENGVEDPDLMHQIFGIDHLLTQIRRAVESLAVIGGSLPSRNSPPILVATTIRRAIAEIPEYARVRRALTPVTASVPGYVSPNLVHLLAALMENATDFSTEKVEVHTTQTGDGIAIEVIDRGTGMSQEKRDALNRLLANPESDDPRDRLRMGQLGLLVAALLARRHKITIQLRPNIVGGTHAIVLLPNELLVEAHEMSTASAPVTSASASPPGRSGAPHSGSAESPRTGPTHELPLAPARPHPPADAGRDRPPLPVRDVSQPKGQAPRPRQQEPAGRPTGGLMASFQSREPLDEGQRQSEGSNALTAPDGPSPTNPHMQSRS
ncbi:ATP-binding protein [Streptomyces sp. NPDC001668]|uniref:ATP-binding protein n=1 Tax=Streptomyces sp. NPDC001668 TaxID=3364598 RepID=UPI00369DDCDB